MLFGRNNDNNNNNNKNSHCELHGICSKWSTTYFLVGWV